MTLAEVLQLYAPLAGLLALAFWVGMLSQKVADLKEDVATLKALEAEGGSSDRLTRLEVTLENAGREIAKLSRGMEGVQRQLGNLMQKPGSIAEFKTHE